MKISEKIYRLRTENNLTQAEFAKIAGETNKAVSTWERDLKTPRIRPLQRICAYFGIDLNLFVDEASDIYKPEKSEEQSAIISRIGRLIEETGLSIRELAEAADCSKSAMQRYISGERDIPTSVIEGLAAAFHVHPAYLFGWVDDRSYMLKPSKEAVTEDGDSLSEDELELIKYYRQLSPERKEDSKIQLKALVERAVQRSEDKK